jgi:hypothetical protein
MMNAERMFAVVLLGIAFFIRILPVTWGQPDPSFARSFHEKGMIHEQTPLHPDEYFLLRSHFAKFWSLNLISSSMRIRRF